MSVTPQTRDVPEAPAGLVVTHAGVNHPAEELARGAAYELFSADELPGFSRDPRPDARRPWHRFVHASEVSAVYGPRSGGDPELEPPLMAPLNRARNWADIHQLSQTTAGAADPVLASVRASALVRRGTPMVKVLSARQLAGHLRGWLPYGFCYREYDIAHLRTPEDLSLLRTDPEGAGRGRRSPRTRCAGGRSTRSTTTYPVVNGTPAWWRSRRTTGSGRRCWGPGSPRAGGT